jgi:tetratricopeptide (TPR) repeat protein
MPPLDAEALARALEAAVGKERDPLRKARLHHDLGLLLERAAGDNSARRAAEHYLAAHALRGDYVAAIHGARRTLIAAGQHVKTLPLFDAELQCCTAPEQRARLLYQKAQLLEHALGRGEEALEVYRHALALDGDDMGVLRAIARHERQLERFAELDRTLERMAVVVERDPPLRAAVIADRARLADLRLGSPAQTIELYLAALAVDPDVAGAAEALKRVGQTQGQWRKVLQALEQEAARTAEGEVAAAAQARMAAIFVDELGDREQAIAALQAAVTQLPSDRMSLRRLAELLEHAGMQREALMALVRLRDLCEDSAERLGLCQRMGELAERELDDAKLAEQHYLAALSLDPGHRPARDALRGLYSRSANHAGLLKLYQSELEAESDGEVQADLLVRMGELCESGLGDTNAAVERYRAALALSAEHELALGALDRLLSQLGRFEELAQVYERVVDHGCDAAQGIAYLMRIGALYEDRLDNWEGAIHAYERVLARNAQHLGALRGVQRAASRAEDHERLIRALDAEVALVDAPGRRAHLMYRAAAVLADEVGDVAGAIARLAQLLHAEPEHRLGLLRIAELYRRARRWDDLIRSYEQRLAATTTGARAAALCCEMGQLCEVQLGRIDEAIACYRRALDQDPDYVPGHQSLLAALRQTERFGDLMAALEARIACASDRREQANLACELGAVLERHFDEPKKALSAYQRALDADAACRPALDARSRLLWASGQHRDLCKVLLAEADAASDPALALDALVRAAALQAEVLGEASAAAATYTKVLERAPGHLGALLALESLHLKLRNREALAELYAQQISVTADERMRAALLRDLARAEDAGSKGTAHTDAALAAYRELLALRPQDEQALDALAEHARATGDGRELLVHEAALAQASADSVVAATHHLRVAEQIEQRDAGQALLAYRTALALDPDSLVATRGLSRTALASGDASALSEAARREARVSGDALLTHALYLRAALAQRDGGELRKAADDATQALELLPDSPQAAELVALLLFEQGELSQLCDVLSRAGDRASDGARAAALYTQVAELRHDRLADLTAAITAAERALARKADHLPALLLLAQYLEAGAQWRRAADTLELCAKTGSDIAQRAAALLSLARLLIDHLDDTARAERCLEQVLKLEPDNRSALSLLARGHLRAGRIDKGAEIAGRLIETAPDDAARSAALLDLARARQQQGNRVEAEAAVHRALAYEGPAGEASRIYRASIGAEFSFARYVEALEIHLAMQRDKGLPTGPISLVIAQVQREGQGDGALALRTLEAASQGDPGNIPLWSEYAAALLQQGQHDRAVEVYRAQLGEHPEQAAFWRGLSAAQRARGRSAEALSVGQPLLVLDAAEGEERVALASRQARPARGNAASISDGLLAELGAQRVLRGPAAALTETLTPVLAKLYPVDLARYGATRQDRVSAESNDPARLAADRVARLVGIEGYELYLHDGEQTTVDLVLGDSPVLMLPRALGRLPKAALVFALARPMMALAHGVGPVHALPAHNLAVALAAAVRRQQPSYGARLASEEELSEAERLLTKAVPWLARKKVDEAASALAAAGPIDLAAWIAAVLSVTAKGALLLCDDIALALQCLGQGRGQPPFTDPLARELLALWASETASRYRQRLQAEP